jgi:hypothetical protein
MRAILCLALVAGVSTPAPAHADQLPVPVKKQLEAFASGADPDGLRNALGTDAFSQYLTERALAENPDRVELSQVRTDVQLGAMSGRAASTSIVAKPSISEFLSAAFESGAVARKSDDTSLTISVNGLMLQQVVRGEIPRGCGSLDNACRSGVGRWLRGLSGSATFATGGGATIVPGQNADEAAAIVDKHQLTAAAVRYELLVRERDDQKAREGLAAAAKALQSPAASFLLAQAALETRIGVAMDGGWKTETLALLKAAAPERREALLLERYQLLFDLLEDVPELTALRAAAFKEYRAYVTAQNTLLAEKLYRKALTVDYLYERPTGQPELHQVRAVFSTPLGAKPIIAAAKAPTGAFTVNAGLSLFNPGLEGDDGWKLRDSQVSAALDWTPIQKGIVRPTYTLAYYYQYMAANGVIKFDKTAITPGGAAIPLPKPAIEVLNTKGAIHVAQFRISIPAAQGVSIPLAVSYANRTELVKGQAFWQGHAGVTYDLGMLKQLLTRQ